MNLYMSAAPLSFRAASTRSDTAGSIQPKCLTVLPGPICVRSSRGSDISGESGRYNRHESSAVELLPGLWIRQHDE